MALMLRKACQPVLDAAGLTTFYADINSTTKGLVIHNVCGKPFSAVHGVTFSRNDVTKDEIVFAVELLTVWLKRNKQKITAYLMARDELTKSSEPEKIFQIKDWKAVITIQMNNSYDNSGQCRHSYVVKSSLEKDKITYYFDEKMDLTAISFPGALRHWNGTLKVPQNVFDSLWKSVNVAIAYYHNKKIVEDMQADLNSCCST